MTTTAKAPRRSASARTARQDRLRAILATLHFLISLLAVLSLFTNRFDLWIDLRLLGGAGTTIIKIIWTATALLLPFCTSPRLSLLGKPRWINKGLLAGGSVLLDLLLIPTYFLLACLAANTVYYFALVARGTYPWAVPMPALAFILLAAWVLLMREWMRRTPKLPPTVPATRRILLLAAAIVFPLTALAIAFLLLHSYAHPPAEPVDLAVVLGNFVLPDGTASPVLEDRTLAAIRLYQQGLAKHLLLSGAAFPRNEPAAMRQVCLAHGIPESAISLDPFGVNTRATAFNAQRFMQARNLATVAACSDDFHLFRTAMSFHQLGITAATAPARPRLWICADPRNDLREMVAILVYKFVPSYRPVKAEDMQFHSPRVVVRKTAGVVEVYGTSPDNGRETLMKTFACITGGNAGDKSTEGDRRTPIGSFHIVYKNPNSKFHLSLGLDYPNAEDAARGLHAGLITQQQYNDILAALHSDLSLPENQQKLWYTKLGGEIFLHGHAEGRTGTAGCIAMTNPDIEELYALLPVGTPVEIRP